MTSRKVLVIDDSKVIRMRVREMLPEGDYEILEAKDGREGLQLIEQSEPTLIMLDFLLPKVSGWEVYQELEKNDLLGAIPLVIMSGRKEEVTEKLQEPFEWFEFIEKPFEKEQLEAAIQEAFRKARKPRPVKAAAPAEVAAPVAVDLTPVYAKLAALEGAIQALQAQSVKANDFAQLQATVAQLQQQPAATGSGGDDNRLAALEAENQRLHHEVEQLKRAIHQIVTALRRLQGGH
ncbi:response regulator [Thermosynechococcus sp. PP45]|uniref:response regulator n=1 Tax=unclassified Thermosynechococcus TaxID=2622553 RepID=UPI002672E76F|nr:MULTISPECIES: response regulator [unclassified Thermosynechococcus]MDR7922541.1 response regulator [Thermosynechococcus sp. HY213]WKT80355.1 response regulator [Thermosynechococcus sp. PP45]WNC23965.1 response regulator [Thermosynechococcus sp. PP551]WNC26543.1 response regulator [Thermosynechococcus sp. PP555]